jgi:hypothetical protein
MRRRDFLAIIGGGTALRPLMGIAQQPERMRRVGALFQFPENDPLAQAIATGLAQGLKRFGWVEGENIRIDYRFAANDPTRINAYAAELVAPASLWQSPLCRSERARYRSFSLSSPIPWSKASFRVSRDPAGTSPASPLSRGR